MSIRIREFLVINIGTSFELGNVFWRAPVSATLMHCCRAFWSAYRAVFCANFCMAQFCWIITGCQYSHKSQRQTWLSLVDIICRDVSVFRSSESCRLHAFGGNGIDGFRFYGDVLLSWRRSTSEKTNQRDNKYSIEWMCAVSRANWFVPLRLNLVWRITVLIYQDESSVGSTAPLHLVNFEQDRNTRVLQSLP